MVRIFIITLVFALAPLKAFAKDNLALAASYQVVHAESLIRAADITLVNITNLFGYDENNEINKLITHNSLNRLIKRTPGLRALFTTNVQGELQSDSFRYPIRNLNLIERPYIKKALSLTPHDLYIGAPIPNPFIGFDSLPLSRPIFNQKGHINGVAVAIMTPDHLIQRQNVCKKCVVSVFKKTGEKLVSFPASVQQQPDIMAFSKKYPQAQVVRTVINKLPTRTIWVNFESYDLMLMYSSFE